MSSVPILMRILAMLAGEVSLAHIELFTQSAYFYFQLLQVFLIRTLTDTVSVVLIQTIESPSAIFQILSQAIPTSSNFYISYFIMQGFTIAPNILTQLISCLTFNLLYKFYDNNTPRALYTRWISLSTLSWGNILPTYTTITVISMCASNNFA